MKDIWPTLLRWQGAGETVAVATLVQACGSVPRPPGARMGMTRSGRMIGSVSGGCVENDVFEHALHVLDTGQPTVVRYHAADPLGPEVGLSCGGTIDVLIEPFTPTEGWQALCAAIQQGRPVALAIGLAPPVLAGRTRVVFADAPPAGSVDPVLDESISDTAQRLASTGGTTVLTLPCGPENASVFIEAFAAPQRLLIVGGTHTAVPLCRLAKVLGFHVTLVDPRTAWATAERFPEADQLVHAWPEEVLMEACRAAPAATSVVILTHDPKFDLPALTAALRTGVRYIGILGSRKTYARRRAALHEAGFSESELARIRAPIGLDLGGRRPEEIALAILAEMVAVRYERGGGALATRSQADAHNGA